MLTSLGVVKLEGLGVVYLDDVEQAMSWMDGTRVHGTAPKFCADPRYLT